MKNQHLQFHRSFIAMNQKTESLIKRKIQCKFTVFTFIMLALFGIPVVTIGYMVISNTVYRLQGQLFSKELNQVHYLITQEHQILQDAGVSGLSAYVEQAQQELLLQLQRLQSDSHSEQLWIINAQKTLLLHPIYPKYHHYDMPYIKTMLAEKSGTIRYVQDNVDYYAVFQWVPEWEWLIVFSIDQKTLFAERTFYLEMVLMSGGLVLIFVLGFSYFLTSGIARKIQIILSYLKEIEHGNLQLSPLPSSSDEIGLIQSGINNMLDKVSSANQLLLDEITHRQHIEQELRESEAYWHLLFQESLGGLVLNRFSDGAFVDANPAYLRLIGYTKEELLTRRLSFLDITPPAYFQAELAQIKKLQETGRYGPYEKVYLHKLGYSVPVRLSGLILERMGERFIWSNVEDITEQKRSEIALREARDNAEQAKFAAETANRAKSTFLANMSHELRTPLNGILGYTQILRRDASLNEKQREGIAIIERSGEYLLTLINDILDLFKVEAGRIELYQTTFNFLHFIEEITELFKMRASQKNIAFIYEPLTALPTGLYADEKRLRQIIINLLSNAVKFTEYGGVSLKIGLVESLPFCDGETVLIRFQIEDTGIGIDDEEIQKIFLPFQQIGEISHKSEGTGLGLSITKNLVELMNGELHVKSALNKGSCFWFILPLKTASYLVKPKENENTPVIRGYAGERRRILIVDDKLENRSVLVNLLQPLGFDLAEADNGITGLEQAMRFVPDLILTDLVMPAMDGFELTRHIRQSPKLQHIAIIAISASVFDYHQNESQAAGCNAFIGKPVHFEELLDLIQAQLNVPWIYDTGIMESNKSSEMSAPHSLADLPLLGPNPQQAQQLYDLVLMGDIAGIIHAGEFLVKQQPELRLFSEKLQELAKQFAEEQLTELLQNYLPK
ncbi:ATP-binding protein [Thioflexithrix psekupsensis]|uniref:histidine kinase n=1 Tax=Thioflexithrix psekupsensis TaxID=1570016 RepID=A0A251X5R3_9GAMM|nr:ATP-binding protein [Thioflexithrix psekupsensis]OUD13086.1 hypothetical protein TPSD3_10580 [Thioflexithrix psekupsensis]